MLEKLKEEYRSIKSGDPGSRFTDHYKQHKESEGDNPTWWSKFGYVAIGLVLLIAGGLLSIPPGFPGFLLWIPGLALLAARSKVLAMMLDRTEAWGRRVWARLKPRRR